MYISVHIPKTAGTTFRELLLPHFGESLCFYYAGLLDWRMQPIADIPAHTRCLHGHINARDYDHAFPAARRLTWVRDPVERVISEFEHHRRSADPANPLAMLISRGGSLPEFASHPDARNTQAKMLQGLAISDFAFIGITDHFDSELERLAATTGIELPAGHRANINPAKQSSRYPLSAAERDLILEWNELDAALYQGALAQAGLG